MDCPSACAGARPANCAHTVDRNHVRSSRSQPGNAPGLTPRIGDAGVGRRGWPSCIATEFEEAVVARILFPAGRGPRMIAAVAKHSAHSMPDQRNLAGLAARPSGNVPMSPALDWASARRGLRAFLSAAAVMSAPCGWRAAGLVQSAMGGRWRSLRRALPVPIRDLRPDSSGCKEDAWRNAPGISEYNGPRWFTATAPSTKRRC